MIRLFLDTAYKHLTCILLKDREVLASCSELCFKSQSENVFPALEKVFDEAGIDRKDVDAFYITEGPGSYTGVRIAMSIVKTMAEILPADIYVISTLQLYAAGKADTMVLMNARADRAYVGIYDCNEIVLEDCVLPLSEIDTDGHELVGDVSLFGGEDVYPDMCEALLNCLDCFRKVEDVRFLTPKYLKESESYLQ